MVMRILRRACRPPVTLALCGLGVVAAAQGDESIYFSEFPIVASVSRLPQKLADAPTAVTVIDREMIKASGVRDLNDIFRLVPGFQTYPNTTEAARATYHGMGDGDYSSRVQVLIDGRSLYSPLFGGGVNWATLPIALEDIERIEVVRGTNAVSYGSNAFLGVINIISVDPALVRGITVSTNYGNQNVRDYVLRTGGKIGTVGDFRFTYKQQNDNGLTDRADWVDSYNSRLLDIRSDFVLGERDSLQFSLGEVQGITQNGRSSDVVPLGKTLIYGNPIRPMRQTDTYVQLLWRRVLSPDSDFQFRYSHVQDKSNDAFTVPIPGYPFYVNQSGDEGVRDEVEWQHSLAAGRALRVVWGASWRDDATRSEWMLAGQGTVHRETGRLFGNAEWKPSPWFTGNLGLAGEQDSLAGFHALPRISGNFHLNRQNTIRLGYSRAYHAGSTIDYRGDWWQVPQSLGSLLQPILKKDIAVYKFAADPNLQSERLDTFELGYLGDWRDWRSSLDVRLFSEKIHHRLFRLDLNDDPKVPASTIPIQNVHIVGLEYQFKWQPLETTRLVFNQTFARITSDYLTPALAGMANAQPIADFTNYSMPRSSTSLLLMQKLPLGMDFSLAGYWQDKMKWSSQSWSAKYHRFDARLAYPFRIGNLGGEVALTVQSLNGKHGEYKTAEFSTNGKPDDRVIERRQWISLRLDY